MVCIHTENQNQGDFYPFVLQEISGLLELLVGHLCCRVTDVPPQPNSPPDLVRSLGYEYVLESNSHLTTSVPSHLE